MGLKNIKIEVVGGFIFLTFVVSGVAEVLALLLAKQ